MSDSSTWPRLSSANYLAWCRWMASEPETLEKWRHIFAESARDRVEFFAVLDRKSEERRSAAEALPAPGHRARRPAKA